MPEQRALLVGIDQYPYPPNNLNSCVNDSLAIQRMLMQTYGFDPAKIAILHNQDATLANVRSALDTLFADAKPGDRLVYFQSSHGYRYPKGDTLIEVLCLYDQFLEDHELVDRTRNLPPEVLTVVLDACHSGGMDKLFFPPGEMPAMARAKVFQASSEQVAQKAGLFQQINKVKFFGRKPTLDTGAIIKNWTPTPPPGAPPAKDLSEGEAELNGALFAACMADQTAAAGSPPTRNLSAFTFALLDQLDTRISLADLCGRVVARLQALNMRQTPVIDVPIAAQAMAAKTFITDTPVNGVSSVDVAIRKILDQLAG
ncbi:MAG TPA: caspase family protein [Kineosporiaceae bacterium]